MKRIQIPDTWLGEPIKGAVEKVLEGNKNSDIGVEPEEPATITPASPGVANKDQYIILQGRKHGSY